MKRMAIFLRGINVNGINMKMDELKSVLESMNYSNVKTILATGNAVATTMDDLMPIDGHKDIIEKKLSAYFEYEAYVVIKSDEQIHNIIEEAKKHDVPDGCHHYILLSKTNEIGKQLEVLFEKCDKVENEQLILGDNGIYWIVPKGYTLESDFGKKVLGRKEYKSVITSRTISTIQKISKNL